jgi:glucose/arabinose dehydrogenase
MTDTLNINRRSLMEHIALLLGATAIPAEAFAAPKRKAKGKAAPKRFFAPSQMALVTALSDTFIPATDTPGAVATKVPALLDGLMSTWAAPATQTRVVASLAAIDKMALDADKKTFAALTPARRKELLIPYDKTALKKVPRKDKLMGLAALLGAPSVADPGYNKVKDLIISLYYTTEIAMTQELVYEHVPGKYVASLKITPGMRPFASLGGLG